MPDYSFRLSAAWDTLDCELSHGGTVCDLSVAVLFTVLGGELHAAFRQCGGATNHERRPGQVTGCFQLSGTWSAAADHARDLWSWRVGDCAVGEPLTALEHRVRGHWALALLGYDLGRVVERIPETARNDHGLPDLWVARYSSVDKGPMRRRGDMACAELRSEMSLRDYIARVHRALEYIRAGDIYQVNLAHRVSASFRGDPLALFCRLRDQTPAPYGAYVDGGDFVVLSNSPELFLRFDARSRMLTTQPIKGTRPRGRDSLEDRRLREECATDTKERAEHVMIVDLLRNDLGRICETGSVRVEELHRVMTLPTVHHAVTTVHGVVREDVGLAEILRATFPGGSITGAPKVRAMEIIEELEPVRRGLYTGAIGLFEPDGSFTLSIAIRTAVLSEGFLRLHVGGAIVADSTPQGEWRETWHKAEAFRSVLTAFREVARVEATL